MGAIASQITSLTIVYSTVYSGADKKTSKLLVTVLCAMNSPGTGEFSAQSTSNADNVSIWWRHHDIVSGYRCLPGTRVPGIGLEFSFLATGETMLLQFFSRPNCQLTDVDEGQYFFSNTESEQNTAVSKLTLHTCRCVQSFKLYFTYPNKLQYYTCMFYWTGFVLIQALQFQCYSETCL